MNPRKLRRYAVSAAMLFLLWLLMTTSFDAQELITGLILALVLAPLIGGGELSHSMFSFLHPKRILYAVLYVPYLFIMIIKSNFDVARRVLNPKLPIRPGIVKVKTKLKSPWGRLLLANSITLTPGTLTVDIRDEDLYIHWIEVETENLDEATRSIVTGFEKYLEVIFG